MARKYTLDLALLEGIKAGSLVMALPPGLEKNLSRTPSAAPHFDAILKFLHLVDLGETGLHAKGENLRWRREACLRAALSEYVSIDNAVRVDAEAQGLREAPVAIRSPHPAIHLVRELRNLELHLSPSRLIQDRRTYLYRWEGMEKSLDSEILLIDDLTIGRLRSLDNVRHYRLAEFAAAVDWFNREQEAWGVVEVLRVVTTRRAEEVVEAFSSP